MGLEEVRSGGLGLGAGHSGVLIDSGDDSPTESPELPVVRTAVISKCNADWQAASAAIARTAQPMAILGSVDVVSRPCICIITAFDGLAHTECGRLVGHGAEETCSGRLQTSILSAQRTSSAASARPPLAQEPQKMQRGGASVCMLPPENATRVVNPVPIRLRDFNRIQHCHIDRLLSLQNRTQPQEGRLMMQCSARCGRLRMQVIR